MNWIPAHVIPAIRRRGASGPAPAVPLLGDFTATPRMIGIALIAAVLGVISAFLALALLQLIDLFTNLLFLTRVSVDEVHLADHDLGLRVLVVPVLGGLVIGLMARYGSERIRGHGIPEAIEAILMNRSRVEPRVAVLKPVSSAISIGSGGPFGAEGPIIMTGGAVGSILGGFFHLTGAERKTLLVAGAAGGMSATFGTPVAAVLLAVELLLFEWKPRSVVPVGVASAVAALSRHYLIGDAPMFVVPEHAEFIGPAGFLGCVAIGICAGLLSMGLTGAVYAAEDAFHRLPIHWMWWPAIGGAAIGIGGMIFPQALGVGYDTIGRLLAGDGGSGLILGVLLVKSSIWAISLGSGTSGGVLAPLLMMGGALGALMANVLPDEGAGFWPLIAMAAILGGTMRSPLTGIVFALELTHDINSMLPLMVAVLCAHGLTVLAMRRSILTEKISRRGYHLGREYSVDPLELAFVKDVMPGRLVASNLITFPAAERLVAESALVAAARVSDQQLFPVVDGDGKMTGVLPISRIIAALGEEGVSLAGEVAQANPVVAYPDEPLRAAANRMAMSGLTRLPVVDPVDSRRVLGIVGLGELLYARRRAMAEEQERQNNLPWARTRPPAPAAPSVSADPLAP